jgi:hypothetical protein
MACLEMSKEVSEITSSVLLTLFLQAPFIYTIACHIFFSKFCFIQKECNDNNNMDLLIFSRICRLSSKKSKKHALLMEVLIGMAALRSEQNLDDGLLELSYFVSLFNTSIYIYIYKQDCLVYFCLFQLFIGYISH